MNCISNVPVQTQGLEQAMCYANSKHQAGHTDVTCACCAAAPLLLADVCPLLADVFPLLADCWLVCSHCLLMCSHCLLMCSHRRLMCSHCLLMCSHYVGWCRRRMLMGGQMKRLLRKLGRTIESAMTQPLWITFRHAATSVSDSCLPNSLIITLPFKLKSGPMPLCHGVCNPFGTLLLHKMPLTLKLKILMEEHNFLY